MSISVVRTVVPLIVAWLISTGAVKWTGLSQDDVTTAVTLAVTAVYYAVVRAAEEYVNPRFGWLLGVARKPAYTPPAVAP